MVHHLLKCSITILNNGFVRKPVLLKRKSLNGSPRIHRSSSGATTIFGESVSFILSFLKRKTRNGVLPSGIENGIKQPSADSRVCITLMFPPPELLRSPMTLGREPLSPTTVSSKTTRLDLLMILLLIALSRDAMKSCALCTPVSCSLVGDVSLPDSMKISGLCRATKQRTKQRESCAHFFFLRSCSPAR